ncbi:MAG: DUF1127 domain-containing protein [Rhodobacteraceae bacterium]|nr:DUF1127 domain-containing protein [Paracoccaceae bacterium]
MTTKTESTARPIFSITLGGLFRHVLEADRRYREEKHIRDLSDDTLKDIGISRDQIDRVIFDRD